MKKLLLVGALILSTLKVYSASVTLGWDASCSTNIVKYTVYYGVTNGVTPSTNITQAIVDDCGIFRPSATNVYCGAYTNTVDAIGQLNNTTVVSNLTVGITYAFVVTSTAASTLSSDFSSELLYTIPSGTNIYVPPAITGFGIRSVGP